MEQSATSIRNKGDPDSTKGQQSFISNLVLSG